MLFLLIFNVMISVVGAGGLSIYNIGVEPTNEYEADSVGSNDPDKFMFLGGVALSILLLGPITGSFIGIVTGKPVSEYAAYGFFGALISVVFVSTYGILTSIISVIPDSAKFGAQIVIGLFVGISGFMFLLGYMQLIRGGIESHM